MAHDQRILYLGGGGQDSARTLAELRREREVVEVGTPIEAVALLAAESFSSFWIANDFLKEAIQIGGQMQYAQILENMPDAVVVLDNTNHILWGNGRLKEWLRRDSVIGEGFYEALGNPEILGPDYCPFHTALSTGEATTSTLKTEDNRCFQVVATPVRELPARETSQTDRVELSGQLIVSVRDITTEMHQQQKLVAIHQAGLHLADLKPDELRTMQVEERIELLKSNIIHYTQDLLHFDVVEIRLLDPETSELRPLLEVGMDREAAERPLFARPQGNGVTGFVAATGKSYLCENTTEDPLYLQGCRGATSSLTVPLIQHDQVIGTFNVESPEPKAFTEADLQFLEIFSREIAMALNTLELLVAEKAGTAADSVEAIHSAVALPVDEILNDSVQLMQKYIGHEPEMVERVQRILKNARDIKQIIQHVGRSMSPTQAHPQGDDDRPLLRGRLVLVADADDTVRSAAHALLERYGCVVETAHNGDEALSMVRNMPSDSAYDVIIADIRLPDMPGFEFMQKLGGLIEPVPLILMTGFGYDPGHSLVKARQAGLQAVLYKPFRLDQLLQAVEKIVSATLRTVSQS